MPIPPKIKKGKKKRSQEVKNDRKKEFSKLDQPANYKAIRKISPVPKKETNIYSPTAKSTAPIHREFKKQQNYGVGKAVPVSFNDPKKLENNNYIHIPTTRRPNPSINQRNVGSTFRTTPQPSGSTHQPNIISTTPSPIQNVTEKTGDYSGNTTNSTMNILPVHPNADIVFQESSVLILISLLLFAAVYLIMKAFKWIKRVFLRKFRKRRSPVQAENTIIQSDNVGPNLPEKNERTNNNDPASQSVSDFHNCLDSMRSLLVADQMERASEQMEITKQRKSKAVKNNQELDDDWGAYTTSSNAEEKISKKCDSLQEPVKLKRTESESSSITESKLYEDELKRSLNQQNQEFENTMKKLREKREERRRLADEEAKQSRFEFQQRIVAFHSCVLLRIRFEEKEQEWQDFLNGLRKPLVSILKSYDDFKNEIKFSKSELDESTKISIQNEGRIFAIKVFSAQKMLSEAFDFLQNLTEEFDGKIFIKMIMKSLNDQEAKCDDIGNALVEVMNSVNVGKQDYKILDAAVLRLNPNSIPNTSQLKRNSMIAREEDYVVIRNSKTTKWFDHFQ
ncbi:DUF713 domain-containing protein [Caenorhabditis elegans]|uniref:Uncharacterized protein n=1 Tax=Caenorhabditis elegans TaxID=6239 RepID=O01627_CAEEL|nr:Uncharacterized protein CELE_ZC196.5 [Caenorhabditis elegans]CCD62095.1 Uncharacterized protein CELE_ZC196.5 [Caenorhabditis elegans]|eukprot:NP_505248.1 Uncharacterized protein CELE_ZC196.5 [Caenorhabditis elegans]